MLVEVTDSLLDFVQVLLELLVGVGVVIGEVELLAGSDLGLKVEFVAVVGLDYPVHVLGLHFLVGHDGGPAFVVPSGDADLVDLIEVLILGEAWVTLEKYSKIRIFLMTRGMAISCWLLSLK